MLRRPVRSDILRSRGKQGTALGTLGVRTGASWRALLPVFLALIPTVAAAQSGPQIPVARELISIAVNPSSDFSAKGRSKFVLLLCRYCREMLSTLPTNTPKEDAWVVSESSTSDTTKTE